MPAKVVGVYHTGTPQMEDPGAASLAPNSTHVGATWAPHGIGD